MVAGVTREGSPKSMEVHTTLSFFAPEILSLKVQSRTRALFLTLSLTHTRSYTHTHNGLRHNKFSGKGFYTSKSPFNLHMRTHTAGNRLVFIKQPA